MKRSILAVLVILCFLCGCASKEKNLSAMEKIQKQLNEMQSYQCIGTMKRISNKGENTYEMKQSYQMTGEYKLELTAPESVAGNYTVFDGKTICQYNPRVNGRVIIDVPESQPRNELFLGAFVKNYVQSEDVSMSTANLEENNCTILEAVIPGDNKYLATEKLWIDNETIEPVQFVIYDSEGKERYIINYKEFEYNVAFEKDFFHIDKE